MSDYTQIRIALGLTEEQAATLVNAAAFERGVCAATYRILKAQECRSVDEAIAKRVPLALPNATDLLLADAPVEEGELDA